MLLPWAAEKGHEAMEKLLAERDVDVGFKSSIGRMLLSCIAEYEYEEVVSCCSMWSSICTLENGCGSL
jgi:hypothetical protein